MTTYNLTLTLNEGPIGSSTSRILASLTSDEPEVMAATLRALADRLDPPKPPRPAHRGAGRDAEGFPLVHRRGATGLIDFDDPALRGAVVHRSTNIPVTGKPHAGTCDEPQPLVDVADPPPVLRKERPRGSQITADGCGPEHTFTGSCALRDQPGAVTA